MHPCAEHCGDKVQPTQEPPATRQARLNTAWLLYLHKDVFKGFAGAALAAELAEWLEVDERTAPHPIMIFNPSPVDGGSEFHEILGATPVNLQNAGLYGPLAVEWRAGEHRPVSVRLLAKLLGAHMVGLDPQTRLNHAANYVARLTGFASFRNWWRQGRARVWGEGLDGTGSLSSSARSAPLASQRNSPQLKPLGYEPEVLGSCSLDRYAPEGYESAITDHSPSTARHKYPAEIELSSSDVVGPATHSVLTEVSVDGGMPLARFDGVEARAEPPLSSRPRHRSSAALSRGASQRLLTPPGSTPSLWSSPVLRLRLKLSAVRPPARAHEAARQSGRSVAAPRHGAAEPSDHSKRLSSAAGIVDGSSLSMASSAGRPSWAVVRNQPPVGPVLPRVSAHGGASAWPSLIGRDRARTQWQARGQPQDTYQGPAGYVFGSEHDLRIARQHSS